MDGSQLMPSFSIVIAQQDTSRSLLDYIAQGGPIGMIIILISLVAIGMIAAQLFRIRRDRLAPPELIEDLRALLADREIELSIQRCKETDSPSFVSRVVGAALRRSSRSQFGLLELRSAVEEMGQLEVERMYRMTDGIGLIASVAPMLGLLGTVVGMLGAFDTITLSDGPARPDQLAGSISQALITTVLGLIVAIPATAMYTYLRNRIDHLTTEIGETIDDLIAPLEAADSSGANPQ